jgi:hypothetical protein
MIVISNISCSHGKSNAVTSALSAPTSVYEMHGSIIHCEASRVFSLQSRFEHELRSLKNLPASDPAVRYPEWHEIPVLSEQEQRRRERNILEQRAALSESKSSRLYLWLYNMWQRSGNVGLRQGSRLPLSCEPLQCQVTVLWFREALLHQHASYCVLLYNH